VGVAAAVKTFLSLAHAKRLAAMSDQELANWLAKCTPRDLLMIDTAFELWAQHGQLPPQSEDWRVWLMMAGRGFGKTRAGAEWVHRLAMTGGKRIALVAASIDEARTVMVEGASGLLTVARQHRLRVTWEPSLGRLKWVKGSVAQLFSGDHADGLRGPEHHNEALQRIDLLLCPLVESVTLSAPPTSPATGTCYLVANDATGAWAGKEGMLAGYSDGGWRYIAPIEGMRVLDRSSGLTVLRTGGGWETGVVRAEEYRVGGLAVVRARQPAISDPAGGTVIDSQCRSAVGSILAMLRTHGLIAS